MTGIQCCDRPVVLPPNSHCHLLLATLGGHGATTLPVEGGVLHKGIGIPILDDHLAAHAGKALWVVPELPSHLWAGEDGGRELSLLPGWR